MVFPVVMYGCKSWTIRKAEHQRTDAFELWFGEHSWESLGLQRYNQSILKETSSQCSLEGLMLKLKLQYFGHWCKELTHLKRPWCWKSLKVVEERDDRGWDGWMASLTQWTWFWVDSRSLMDREAWRALVHGVAKSQTWLSNGTELNWSMGSVVVVHGLICSTAYRIFLD